MRMLEPVTALAVARRRLAVASRIASHAGEEVAARYALRALQPYTVNVWSKSTAMLRTALEPLFAGSSAWVLNRELFPTTYEERYGLVIDDEPPAPQVGALIV